MISGFSFYYVLFRYSKRVYYNNNHADFSERLIDGASDGEVELASRSVASTRHRVEAVAPVEAEESEHRQIDANADAGGAVHLERIEVLEAQPAVTSLKESHGVDGSRGVERQGITELEGIFGEDVAAVHVVVVVSRGKRFILVAAHAYDFLTVEHVARGDTVAAKVEAVERRRTDVVGIMAKVAESDTCHQHQLVIKL